MQQQENSAYSLRATLGGLLQIGFGAFVLGLVIIVGLAVVSNLQGQSERGLASAIGHAVGEIEGSHASTMMQEEADFKHRLALAEAEVRRLSDFYAAFYQAVGVASQRASEWEGAAVTRDEAAIRLIEAMASDGVLPGFRARAELSRPRHTDSLEVQQVAEYEGAELIGQAFTLRNLGPALVDLAGEREAPAGALAFAYGRNSLEPGESTQAFLVFTKGGLE